MTLFQVSADGRSIPKLLSTLDAAKEFVSEHTTLDETVRIESFAFLTPSQGWRFVQGLNDRVEGVVPW